MPLWKEHSFKVQKATDSVIIDLSLKTSCPFKFFPSKYTITLINVLLSCVPADLELGSRAKGALAGLDQLIGHRAKLFKNSPSALAHSQLTSVENSE